MDFTLRDMTLIITALWKYEKSTLISDEARERANGLIAKFNIEIENT